MPRTAAIAWHRSNRQSRRPRSKTARLTPRSRSRGSSQNSPTCHVTDLELAPGVVAWAALEPVRGREQGGHRLALVVASEGYLDAVTRLTGIAGAVSDGCLLRVRTWLGDFLDL